MTCTASSDGSPSVSVGAGGYTDAAGNTNTVSNSYTWTYDGTAPTMVIASTTSGVSDGSKTNDGTIALTFTSSEATTNFASGDVSVSGGTLSNFAGSGTDYTATFTPSGDGATTIDVGASFTDAVGNANSAATQFNWEYDGTAPTMTISTGTVSSGGTTNTAAIALTFTASEATSDFIAGDITVTGCNLGSLATTSSTVYTATCTATSDGTPTVIVAANKFSDGVGNTNSAASNTYTWTYDGTAPTMLIATAT